MGLNKKGGISGGANACVAEKGCHGKKLGRRVVPEK